MPPYQVIAHLVKVMNHGGVEQLQRLAVVAARG